MNVLIGRVIGQASFGQITKISQYMYLTLLVVVILTAIALVAVALGIARAIPPRSFNPQKDEAYECGIPTRKSQWIKCFFHYQEYCIGLLCRICPVGLPGLVCHDDYRS